MIQAQNVKKVLIQVAGTTNAGTATLGNIDTLGYDYATLDLVASTSNNTTNTLSVFKLQESDDTVATNFADVSGFVGGTSFTIPAAVTAATSQTVFSTFNVDLKARKRYLRVLASPVTTQDFNLVAQLSRPEQAPVGATAQNVGVIVNG